MNSNDIERLDLDIRKFFDFDNHPHGYSIFIWKGDFTFRDQRTAATYADIAARFELAIEWIKQIKQLDWKSRFEPSKILVACQLVTTLVRETLG